MFAPEGICMTFIGYTFKIDTSTSASICCHPPMYGPNKNKVIGKQLHVLLDDKWVRECKEGSYGAPIILVLKPYQEEIEKIEDLSGAFV